MICYGLENKVAIITGANNPQGIGATTALALAREGAKVVLVYKKVLRPFDPTRPVKTVWTDLTQPMQAMPAMWNISCRRWAQTI